MSEEEVPMKYKTKIQDSELKYIEVKYTSVAGGTCKEQVPKYSGNETPENFLYTISKLRKLAITYDWWNSGNGPVLAFETMRRELSHSSLTDWNNEV